MTTELGPFHLRWRSGRGWHPSYLPVITGLVPAIPML